MLKTGIRISECIALEWNDIDFKNQTLTINKQYYRYRLTSTKNYETRIIDLEDDVIELLREYQQYQQKVNNTLLFSLDGSYVSVNNLREHHFKNILSEVEEELDKDLSYMTPHCLRHTHATYLLSNGVSVEYVSKRLGHKDANTTLKIYYHSLPSDKTKALNVLSKIKIKQSKMQSEN